MILGLHHRPFRFLTAPSSYVYGDLLLQGPRTKGEAMSRFYSQDILNRLWECSFGLFNYDSFVSFRAIGVIWGIRELTAELVCLLFWHSSSSLPYGGLFLVPTLWGTLPCPYPVGDSSLSLPCGGPCFVPYPAMGPIIEDMKTICTWTARE